MNNTIIIIESPNKISKIESITGFKTFATGGHFKELSSEIVKDYENYQPQFKFKANKKDSINKILSFCENKEVIIATDPDREGYGIAYHFYLEVKNKAKNIKRALFHEITPSGIKKGLQEAVPFSNTNKKDYEAFCARIVGDKLVGFILSPKYSKIMEDKNISIGRVQSPALFLIVKKEREIKEFYEKNLDKITNYKIQIEAIKNEINFNLLSKETYENIEKALEAIDNLKNGKIFISSIEKKEVKQNPKKPFRTSQLQESANQILGFAPEKTMLNAQSLFEKGLITYHRTDSNSLSKEFLDEVEKLFKNEEWFERKEYKAGKQSQAEAHEAIRITHAHKYEDIEKIAQDEKLSNDEINLYKLIYINSIQSQAKPAINEVTHYTALLNFDQFEFTISKSIYKGFKELFLKDNEEEEKENNEEEQELNLSFENNEILNIINFKTKEIKKQPPKRYKEANFINLLEKNGIGRPSTYATYLPKLLEREYIILEKKGKNNEIIPTQKGFNLVDNVKEKDFWILDTEYTKNMEELLDNISSSDNKIDTYLNYIKILHQKLEFKKLNENSEPIKPSEKQLQLIQNLLNQLNEINVNFNINIDKYKNYENDIKKTQPLIQDLLKAINENKKQNKNNTHNINNENKQPIKPSEKQIQFLEKLAKELNIKLSSDYKEDIKVCSRFIDLALNIKKEKNK